MFDSRTLIQNELAERCRKNPRYSMRAFARASGVSHTVLSLVLSQKRPLSTKAAAKLADFLDLDPARRKLFLGQRTSDLNQSLLERSKSGTDYEQISLDVFDVISDWYHFAILSLLELEDAKFEARWIAKNLRISEMQAKLAMERLQRLGLVSFLSDGRWKQTGKPIAVENKNSTASTRRFHKQLLAKAGESLENDSVEVRDFSSITFSMDPVHVEYAKKRIQAFRRELSEELESKGSPRAVYNLTVQLFPVTPIGKKGD